MNIIERSLQAYKFQRQVGTPKHDGGPQPEHPKARIIIGCITSAGLSADGKGSKMFLAPFCQELRRCGFSTYFCTSVRQIERLLDCRTATILINVYGEDHHNITSPAMARAESKASIVINRSEMGAVIADKQLSLEHFTKFGVPMPPPPQADGAVFSNERFGTGRTVEVVENASLADQSRYNRALIDTVYSYQGRSYYTSVRLMCIADQIFHAMVRARPVEDGNPSVTGTDTPLDSALLRYLQKELVDRRMTTHQELARRMNDAIGPSFVAHDVLVENGSENVFVNETGYKFYVSAFRRHLDPISDELPFLAPFFDRDEYARSAAHTLVNWVIAQGTLTDNLCKMNRPDPTF